MPSKAIFAQGTLLKIGDGGSPTETFATIAEVRSINGPGLTSDSNDITTHDTSDGFREFSQGLKDGGSLDFDINFVPTIAEHSASSGLLANYLDGGRRNFQMVFPDQAQTTWVLHGFVQNFSINAPVDDVLTASVSIKLSGLPDLGA
jgi:predicted secreted protein